jgi:hypothetical protein
MRKIAKSSLAYDRVAAHWALALVYFEGYTGV